VAKPLLLIAILAALAVAGCSSGGGLRPAEGTAAPADVAGDGSLRVVADLPPPLDSNGGTTQMIAAGDTLSVDVFQVDTLDATVQVDNSGNISLALVGSVAAAGKSLTDLEAELERRYGARYLQRPDITVSMKESVGQRVTVDGEVRRAGIYPIAGQATLLQVIATAGGFNDIGDPDKVYVFRTYGTEQLVAQYNVSAIRAGKRADPRIYGGDVVVSFASGMKVLGSNLKDALGLARSATGLVL
jgi:polysaccharide export outer membrane protein